MRKLLKWELKNTLLSTRVFVISLVSLAMFALVVGVGIYQHGGSYELFVNGLYGSTDTMMLIGAIFAGMSISGAYADRYAQAAVLAGSGRSKFVTSKCLSYVVAMAIFFFIPLVLTSVAGLIIQGPQALPVGIMHDIIVPTIMVYIVILGMNSIFIASSFLVKSLGAAIGINVALYMATSVGTNIIAIVKPSTTAWMPWTQDAMIQAEQTMDIYLKAIAIIAVTIVVFVSIAFAKFSKTELK
ncbi:MAG: hypothetical protein LBN22_03280 [Clostridiales Family XIII bacterium]|nr:hypothetical protein [Clostridiales Family XIII bacterium]